MCKINGGCQLLALENEHEFEAQIRIVRIMVGMTSPWGSEHFKVSLEISSSSITISL
jgi:hypothetical protein